MDMEYGEYVTFVEEFERLDKAHKRSKRALRKMQKDLEAMSEANKSLTSALKREVKENWELSQKCKDLYWLKESYDSLGERYNEEVSFSAGLARRIEALEKELEETTTFSDCWQSSDAETKE